MELYEVYVHPWSGGQEMFIEAHMYTYMYNLCTNIRTYWHRNSQLQKSWVGQCWWGWKLPEYVSKNDNIYTSCAIQLQLVSKFSWSKQIVKWLPTPMSPPHKSCSACSSHWSLASYRHGDPSSLSASSLWSFAIGLGVSSPIDPKEAYLFASSSLCFQQLLETGHGKAAAESCMSS